ncbi:hypothetical protein ACEPPN_001738 [Leptodophora sp. 'Broadleaf-Isolate-01']
MAERTEILSMFETGYEAQSGHETNDACWLEEALRREAAFEEERSRVLCAAPDLDPFDSWSPTPCLRCGVSFHTEAQFRSHIPTNTHKCCFPGCDRSPFKYPKDLRRHINDVHNTTRLYKYPVDGCRTNHLFKPRDNLQHHIRKQHP